MLALGFFSPVTAGPLVNILSRMQLGVRAAAGPTVSARTVLSGSRSVCDLSFDCEDSAHNVRSGSCGNIITRRSTWSQRGQGVRRTEGARGFSSLPTARTISAGLWSKAPIGGEASLGGTRDEKIEVAAEGEKDEDRGGKTFVVESISPSSVAAFKQCPKLFYYRWVLHLPTPATRETLRGIAVHEVLSKFFEPGQQESKSPPLDRLHELFRGVMTDIIASEKKEPKHGYHKLFQSRDDEVTWAVECMDLLANFVVFERVNSWDGAPWEVEFKMRHNFDPSVPAADANESGAGGGSGVRLGGDAAPASCGVSASPVSRSPSDVPGMSVTGIIDRLDRCRDGKLRVVDYKTGKIPDLKYSDAMNQKIMDDKFYQLQIYALLVERVLGEVPREMRIVYLKGPESVTRELDPRVLPAVEQDLRSIWDQIASFLRENNFPPRQSRLCDWCSFKDRCPAFAVEKTRAGVIGEGEDVRIK